MNSADFTWEIPFGRVARRHLGDEMHCTAAAVKGNQG